jgi:hypothetical protein
MHIRVIDVTGRPDEVASLPQLLDLLRPLDDESAVRTSDAALPGVSSLADLPPDVARCLLTRGPSGHRRDLLVSFLRPILDWPDVDIRVGRSRRNHDGLANMLRIHRRGSSFGAFVYLSLPKGNLKFRLPTDYDISDFDRVVARQLRTGEPYGLALQLESNEAVSEALRLSMAAYDNAVASTNGSALQLNISQRRPAPRRG